MADRFKASIVDDYYFEMMLDELPIWGYVGELETKSVNFEREYDNSTRRSGRVAGEGSHRRARPRPRSGCRARSARRESGDGGAADGAVDARVATTSARDGVVIGVGGGGGQSELGPERLEHRHLHALHRLEVERTEARGFRPRAPARRLRLGLAQAGGVASVGGATQADELLSLGLADALDRERHNSRARALEGVVGGTDTTQAPGTMSLAVLRG